MQFLQWLATRSKRLQSTASNLLIIVYIYKSKIVNELMKCSTKIKNKTSDGDKSRCTIVDIIEAKFLLL